MMLWIFFAILGITSTLVSALHPGKSSAFSYNQNRRYDFFQSSQDGSHGYNYQYGNPDSDVQVSYKQSGIINNRPSYANQYPQTYHDSDGSYSDQVFMSNRPKVPMAPPKSSASSMYTPNSPGNGHRSPWLSIFNQQANRQKPDVDVGGHVYTIPRYPNVDTQAESMKFSGQNNEELFRNLYATHPDIIRYVNPESGPLNVLGLPHNLRLPHPLGHVNGFLPPIYEDNKKLPTPVVDPGVRKGSGYIDDPAKFTRIYDFHPHIHGYVNPEKDGPINDFGVPPNLRFSHPNGNVDGFRPPEVSTNKFLAGPAEDHVQPINERPILLRFNLPQSTGISAHPKTYHADANNSRAIYQSSQSRLKEYFSPAHESHQSRHDGQFYPGATYYEPEVSASAGYRSYAMNRPGESYRREKFILSNSNYQKQHAKIYANQQQTSDEVNYAEKQSSPLENSFQNKNMSENMKAPERTVKPYAQYSQGPIRYVNPQLIEPIKVSISDNSKYYITPTTYRPINHLNFMSNLNPEITRKNTQSKVSNQNPVHLQNYRNQLTDNHSRFSYQAPHLSHRNHPHQHSKQTNQCNCLEPLHGSGNFGYSYENYNENDQTRSQRPTHFQNFRNSQRSNAGLRQSNGFQNTESINHAYYGDSIPRVQHSKQNHINIQHNINTRLSSEEPALVKHIVNVTENTSKSTPAAYRTSSEKPGFIYKRPPLDYSKIRSQTNTQPLLNAQINKGYQQYDKDSRYYDSTFSNQNKQFNAIKYDRTLTPVIARRRFVNNHDKSRFANYVNEQQSSEVSSYRYSPTSEYVSYQQAPSKNREDGINKATFNKVIPNNGNYKQSNYKEPGQQSHNYEVNRNLGNGQRPIYRNHGSIPQGFYHDQRKIVNEYDGNYDSYGYTNPGGNVGYGYTNPGDNIGYGYTNPGGNVHDHHGDHGHGIHYGAQHEYGATYGPPHDYKDNNRPIINHIHNHKPKSFLAYILPRIMKSVMSSDMHKEITFFSPDYKYLNHNSPQYRRYSYGHEHDNPGYPNHGYRNHGYSHPTKGVTMRFSMNNFLKNLVTFLQ